MEQESFDIASLEGFRADLVVSGFEPVARTERRMWRGPIHPAFAGLLMRAPWRLSLTQGGPIGRPVSSSRASNTNTRHSVASSAFGGTAI